MNVAEYFGTLLQSVTETHKKHLMTGKYSDHKALNEFYDEMPDLIDALIADFNKPELEIIETELAFVLSDLKHTIRHLKR